jgi:hypothetical protein
MNSTDSISDMAVERGVLSVYDIREMEGVGWTLCYAWKR